MNAQLTISYMAEQTNQTRLDKKAHQGSLAQEAAAQRDVQVVKSSLWQKVGYRIGLLVQQVVGGTATAAHISDEAIIPNR